MEGPAERRLAFRELGLCIGLHAIGWIDPACVDGEDAVALLRDVARYGLSTASIERFWLEPSRRKSPTWRDHRDINDVMLATSLAPGGYLGARRA